MRKLIFFFALVALRTMPSIAQTTISGDISGMIFKPSGNPWIVKENIYIENGNKAAIKPGCIFLFKPFTGIIVQGSLDVEGQPDAPVIFTSINDSVYNEASVQRPEPFDWNGISIEKTAETIKLSNFVISFSVYGIKSKQNDVVLEQGVFRQNGQYNFTINEKIQDVENNLPYSYNISEKMPKLQKPFAHGWVKPVGVGTLITGTVFLGAMGYFIHSGVGFDEKYDNAADRTAMQKYSGRRDESFKNALITGVIGGILVPAGTGLILWKHINDKNVVALYPVISIPDGFQVVVKF